jgi:hypothetical protein
MALHVQYEAESVRVLAPLTEHYDQTGRGRLKNACLESTLVHVRLMIEFLFGRPGECGCRHRSKQDVQPKDFVSEWEPNIPDEVDGWLKLCDRHLVHLSKERSKPDPNIDWDIQEITTVLLGTYQEFVVMAEQEECPQAVILRAALG